MIGILNIILYFFIFSFFGWVLESLWASFKLKKLVSKQALLRSPLSPVYGIGGVALYLLLYRFQNSYLLLFSFGFFILSFVEFIYSLYYEKRYRILWWDYSKIFGNLFGRVCVGYSLLWGIMTVLFFKFFLPFTYRIVASMGDWQKLFMCVFLIFYYINDAKNTKEELKNFKKGEKSLIEEKFFYIKRKGANL